MQFIFPELLTSYINTQTKLQEQYQSVESSIGGSGAEQDKLLSKDFLSSVEESCEMLKQAFAENQLPLLTSVSEDMYDDTVGLLRLFRTESYDRSSYYDMAPQAYKNMQTLIDLRNAVFSRYEEKHSQLFT